MKTLLLLRHAKAGSGAIGTPDRERPLNDRGKSDAPMMGKVLKKYDLRPDLVFCSPAVRTRTTAELFLKAANYHGEVRYVDQIYDASIVDLMSVLSSAGDANTVLMIGHNPGMQELASTFAGGASLDFPTSALACIEIDCHDWVSATQLIGRLQWLLIPKLVKEL